MPLLKPSPLSASEPAWPRLAPRIIFQRNCLPLFKACVLGNLQPSSTHRLEGKCSSLRWQEAPDTQPGAEKESLPSTLEEEWGRKPRKADGPLLRSGAPLRVLRMGCPRRKALSVLLILVPAYLRGASSQRASPAGQRKPFFERLRGLEEQVSLPTTRGAAVCQI